MKSLPTRIELIQELVKPGSVGAEIGVYRGDFSLELVKREPRKLYLVDAWKSYDAYALDSINATNQDQNCIDTKFRLQKWIDEGMVEVVRGMSTEVANRWDGMLSWIFLDANHGYSFVLEDLRAWSKFIEPGGFIMCHDYTDTSAGAIAMNFGVVKAVNQFCLESEWEVTHITEEHDWPSCALKRK
jgi:hypothetical protein